jgi:hypothetical protein
VSLAVFPGGTTAQEPLWRRALARRSGQGAHARLVLWALVNRTPHKVSLVEIRNWPRSTQGAAYLWATDYLNGREDAPPPWVYP